MKNISTDNKLILSISSLIFIFKWLIILFYNFEYEFITKIIFNLDDRQYFTLIHNFSNFYFNPTFNTDFQNVKLLPFPIYSIIFHSIFYKIFNNYKSKKFPNSEYISRYGFYLPSSLSLKNHEIDFICSKVNNILS